jgi:hypothetical protein
LTDKDLVHPNNIDRKLDRIGEAPPGTVRVAGAQTPQGEIQDFFMDRYEVTNVKFQKFILDGGYRNKDYWQHDFVEDGHVISWEEGISRFVDDTGRPGPSSWLGGTFHDGMANHPVSGVSWYEAAAYAEYVGKSLPTGTHWGVARGEYSPLIQYPQLGGFALAACRGSRRTALTISPETFANGARMIRRWANWCGADHSATTRIDSPS